MTSHPNQPSERPSPEAKAQGQASATPSSSTAATAGTTSTPPSPNPNPTAHPLPTPTPLLTIHHYPSPATIEARRLYSIRIKSYLKNVENSVPPFRTDYSQAGRTADLDAMSNKVDAWSSIVDNGRV